MNERRLIQRTHTQPLAFSTVLFSKKAGYSPLSTRDGRERLRGSDIDRDSGGVLLSGEAIVDFAHAYAFATAGQEEQHIHGPIYSSRSGCGGVQE